MWDMVVPAKQPLHIPQPLILSMSEMELHLYPHVNKWCHQLPRTQAGKVGRAPTPPSPLLPHPTGNTAAWIWPLGISVSWIYFLYIPTLKAFQGFTISLLGYVVSQFSSSSIQIHH